MGWLVVIAAIAAGWSRVSWIAAIGVLGSIGAVMAVLGAQQAAEWRNLAGIGSNDFAQRMPYVIAWPFILATGCYWLGRGGAALFSTREQTDDAAGRDQEPPAAR